MENPEFPHIAQAAEEDGVPVAQRVKEILAREDLRLYYVFRCRAKPKKPLGNPEVYHTAERLRKIYLGLRNMYGTDFERLFRAQEEEVEQLAAKGDLEGLLGIERDKPWTRRRDVEPSPTGGSASEDQNHRGGEEVSES